MTDTPGGTPPFGSFPGMTGFPQGDMMEKMWDMMKLNPFAAAAAPGGSPSLSMMSDMLAPLTNVEELDKRIKDMRAIGYTGAGSAARDARHVACFRRVRAVVGGEGAGLIGRITGCFRVASTAAGKDEVEGGSRAAAGRGGDP
jgi:hypothetical protein